MNFSATCRRISGDAEARYLLRLDLDPRDVAVVPDPHLPESQLLQERLRFVETPEDIGLDPGAVGDARREAGERRLVPGRQAHPAGDLPDLLLGEAGLAQRAPHAERRRGPAARPVVVQIVDIRAVGHPADAVLPADGDELAEELRLAEEASLGGVGREGLVLEFVGVDPDDGEPQLAGGFHGLGTSDAGYVSDEARTHRARSPRTSAATAARSVLSTPPE